MFDSLAKDIRYELTRGNSVMRLIFINCIIFLVIILARIVLSVFNSGDQMLFSEFIDWFTLPVSFKELLFQPWSLFTYSFIHFGIWHILFNMLTLFWFGMIVGDLIGYKRILPLYTLGAIVGGLFAMVFLNLLNDSNAAGSRILGASASVMAIILAAGTLAPDYNIRLILLGNIRIKYIIAVIIIFDLLAISFSFQSGGAFAHLGGGLTGYLFVLALKKGLDPTALFYKKQWQRVRARKKNQKKSKVVNLFETIKAEEILNTELQTIGKEKKLDQILDKIKKHGQQSLTQEELTFLEQISKS